MAQGYLLNEIEVLVKVLYEGNSIREQNTIDEVQKQSDVFKSGLSDAVFRLRKEKQVYQLIEKYHNALVILIEELLKHRHVIANDVISEHLYAILNDLLLFVEKRFSRYININRELPPRYISLLQKDWPDRLSVLGGRFQGTVAEETFNFVSQNLLRFASAHRHVHLPLRAVFFRKELIREIELLSLSSKMSSPLDGLQQLLMYMNYNSRGYLEHYTNLVATMANSFGQTAKKEETLQKGYRKFRKQYCNTAIGLHPNKENLKSMIGTWYQQQFELFAEKKTSVVLPYGKINRGLTMPRPLKITPKIFCTFSANHLGIFLRACEQAKIVRVPSLSVLFKAVIPFVATSRTPELSPDSVRSKSYQFTESDRLETISILEQLIEKIKYL